jgi:hypothetical protein
LTTCRTPAAFAASIEHVPDDELHARRGDGRRLLGAADEGPHRLAPTGELADDGRTGPAIGSSDQQQSDSSASSDSVFVSSSTIT